MASPKQSDHRGHSAGQYKFYSGVDRKKLQAILRDRGFRSTEGRLTMLSVIKASHQPLGVADIATKCGSNLDETNVYRALEALTMAGILNRTDLRLGGAHYEFNQHHHHHVTCTGCGTVKDLDMCEFDDVAKKALRQVRGFASINSHSLELFGTCSMCVKA
jgi:Fur family zinc uptake transcriptional regulator